MCMTLRVSIVKIKSQNERLSTRRLFCAIVHSVYMCDMVKKAQPYGCAFCYAYAEGLGLHHNKVCNKNKNILYAQHQQPYTLPPEINAAVVHFDPADFLGALQAVGNGHNGGNEQPGKQSGNEKQDINCLGGAGLAAYIKLYLSPQHILHQKSAKTQQKQQEHSIYIPPFVMR